MDLYSPPMIDNKILKNFSICAVKVGTRIESFIRATVNPFGKVVFRKTLDVSLESINSPEGINILIFFRIQEFKEAISFFTQALSINPLFLDAYIGRGNSYMEYGHEEAIKQAQKDFLKALHLNPLCTKARISLCYNLQVIHHSEYWKYCLDRRENIFDS